MSSKELQTGNGGTDINITELIDHMSDIGNWTFSPDDGRDLRAFLEDYLTPLAGVFAAGRTAFSQLAETLADNTPVADTVTEVIGQMSTVMGLLEDTAEQLPEAMRVGNAADLERIEHQRPNEQLANVADN